MIFRQIENHSQNAAQIQTNVVHMGIEEIYPDHGNPFKVEKAVADFEKWKKRSKAAI